MNNKFLEIYFSKKIFLVFLMGIASGIPLYVVLSTLFIWITREGVDIATVGLFGLTQLPWSLKFIWAPIFDHITLTKLGRRRSWLLITQILLIISIMAFSSVISVFSSYNFAFPKTNFAFTFSGKLLYFFQSQLRG